MSNMWGRQEELAGDSEMNGEVGSSINVVHPAVVLSGPSGVHISASVAEVVPAIEEHVKKLCSAAIVIAIRPIILMQCYIISRECFMRFRIIWQDSSALSSPYIYYSMRTLSYSPNVCI